jgi:hypothetical protein
MSKFGTAWCAKSGLIFELFNIAEHRFLVVTQFLLIFITSSSPSLDNLLN